MNIGMLVSNEVVRDPRVMREARSLAQHGHRVRIVGWDRFDPSVPDGPIGDGIEIALVRSRGLMKVAPGALFKNPVFWRRALQLSLTWPADLWWAHDLDTLHAICDRIAVLADRKVVAVGTIPELLALDHPWIQEYFNGPRGRAATASYEHEVTA